jgi:hypothetical protein
LLSPELVFVATNLDPCNWILINHPVPYRIAEGALQRGEGAGNRGLGAAVGLQLHDEVLDVPLGEALQRHVAELWDEVLAHQLCVALERLRRDRARSSRQPRLQVLAQRLLWMGEPGKRPLGVGLPCVAGRGLCLPIAGDAATRVVWKLDMPVTAPARAAAVGLRGVEATHAATTSASRSRTR